jgi:magnesium chelatase family protein
MSHAGLVGRGRWPRPSEVSLRRATGCCTIPRLRSGHHLEPGAPGRLFLDELPEFGQQTLEVLRQPLDAKGRKLLTISRTQGTLTFPANFLLVAAMNPCPCGYYGDPGRECTRSLGMVSKYQKRISGPR